MILRLSNIFELVFCQKSRLIEASVTRPNVTADSRSVSLSAASALSQPEPTYQEFARPEFASPEFARPGGVASNRTQAEPTYTQAHRPEESFQRADHSISIARSTNSAPRQTLWKQLEEETLRIDRSDWHPHFYDVAWAQESFEIPSGPSLTAHRIAKNISDHYFVAFKAPLEADWTYFWTSVFNRNVTSLVDLTQHPPYDGPGGIYYPEKEGDQKMCENIEIVCVAIEGNMSTYQLTDTSIGPDSTKIIQRYHYREWPDGSAITLAQLQKLVEDMELFAREPKQPLWIHCFMGVGRTGTLITALILKEKQRQLTHENLQETLVNIIISCRKERAAEFVQTPVQAELLYQYGLSLIARTSPSAASFDSRFAGSSAASALAQLI